MKINFNLLICFSAFFILNHTTAQKVEFQKGKSYKHDGINLNFIGKSDQFIFYSGQNYDEEIQYVLKANIKTLKIVEKTKLSDLKLKGKVNHAIALNNQLLFISAEELKAKIGILTAELKVTVFDANGKLKDRKELTLMKITEEEYDFWYNEKENNFLIITGDAFHEFNSEFKPILGINFKINHPQTTNYKYISINTFGNKKTPKEETFFSWINKKEDLLYYCKAQFIPNDSCILSSGHIQKLEIISYDTFSNSIKKLFKFDIREKSYLLNYSISIDEEGRIIIIGIYQDKEMIDSIVHLGMFSQIIEADLHEKTPTYYLDMTGKHNLLYNDFSFNLHSLKSMLYKNNYTATHYDYDCKYTGYSYILIDRNNASINFEKLKMPFSCRYKYNSFSGYLNKSHNDSIEWIFFNDHTSNIGKGANDSDLVGYDITLDSISLCFVTFSSSNGFSKRQAIFDAGKEGFSLYFNYNEYYRGEVDSEGYFEIISPAYDINKKNFKLYRFKVKT